MIKLLRALFFLDAAIWLAFAVAVLVINILMTITDQMGLWDWLTLALEVLLLGLLLAVGRRYVGGKNKV